MTRNKCRLFAVSGIVLLAFVSNGLAAFRPCFDLRSCTWNASHIVVVSEGDRIDGVVTVLASWKGDLKMGHHLTLPELAKMAGKEERKIHENRFNPARTQEQPAPTHVTCSRMVLFLIRDRTEGLPGKSKTIWRDANSWSDDDLRVSTAWIEKGRVYACFQIVNPGPSVLIDANRTEREIKIEIDNILGMQNALEKAVSEKSATGMQTVLKQLLAYDSESQSFGDDAFRMIASSGKPGIDLMLGLLSDKANSSLPGLDSKIYSAISHSGSALAGQELLRQLEDESKFWKEKARRLKTGWWNSPIQQEPDVASLEDRFQKSSLILSCVGLTGHPDSKRAILEFEQLWNSLPQLRSVGWDWGRSLRRVRGWRQNMDDALNNLPSVPAQVVNCWGAEQIVVASTSDGGEGKFEVLESWKGQFKKAERLTLPELAPFADADSRVISRGDRETPHNNFKTYGDRFLEVQKPDQPHYVSGKRMILLLSRPDSKPGKARKPGPAWVPVRVPRSNTHPQVMWVEHGKVYWRETYMDRNADRLNPPCRIVNASLSESDLRKKVEEILALQKPLIVAIASGSAAQMGSAIVPILQYDLAANSIGDAALDNLAEAGVPAIPVLRKILADESLRRHHISVLASMRDVKGPAMAQAFAEILRDDVQFWKTTRPDLKDGWWQGACTHPIDICLLREHYYRSITTVRYTAWLGNADGLNAIKEMKAVADSLPSIGAVRMSSNLGDLSQVCDRAIEKFGKLP